MSDTLEKDIYRCPRVLPWAAVLVVFAILDPVTTHYGLSWGAVEANRAVADAVSSYGMVGMVSIKAIVCAGALVAYRILPAPHRVGIPVGLGLVGSLVVTWNLLILVVMA